MDGDKNGAREKAGSQPISGRAHSPEAPAHENITDSQPSISEQAFVDRINRSDRWMIILTATIAFSGVISAVIFGKQLTAMQGQLDEMKSEQRPWVSATIEDTPVVSVGPKKGSVGIAFALKNVGHSVAIDATGIYSAIAEYNEHSAPIADPCTNRILSVKDSKTLFPGDEYTTRRMQLLFDEWDFVYSSAQTGIKSPSLIVVVTGCVTYTYDGSATKHHTPFAYRIYGSEYRPGEPVGFKVEKYGDFIPAIKPVNVYIDGVNPD